MEVVIEIGARRTPRLERLRLGVEPVALGRAFDSDLLLPDKTIDPAHASLTLCRNEQGEQHMQVQDLNSANGLRLNGERLPAATPRSLQSGDRLQLGNTTIRVYRHDHPVGPAHSPSRAEQWRDRLAGPPLLPVITVLGLAVFMWLKYLHLGSDFTANIAIRTVMEFGLQAGLWMLLWATLSKLIRGEFHFWPHWCIGVLGAAIVPLVDELLSIIGFNWQSLSGYRLLDALASATIVTVSMFVALSFATQMRLRPRLAIAALPAVLLLITSYALPLITEQNNVSVPQRLSLSRPPIFKWAPSTTADALVEDSAALFESAQAEAAEQLEAEEAEASRAAG